MKAKLTRRDERDDTPPVKVIPAPENKGDVDVDLLRRHLGLLGEEHDIEWSLIRVRTGISGTHDANTSIPTTLARIPRLTGIWRFELG